MAGRSTASDYINTGYQRLLFLDVLILFATLDKKRVNRKRSTCLFDNQSQLFLFLDYSGLCANEDKIKKRDMSRIN